MISGLIEILWGKAPPVSNVAMQDVLDFSQHDSCVLTRDELEQFIQKKGDLTGITIASDIEVAGLDFANVKMDKKVLQFLIGKSADLRGIDLSNQDLSGMDLTDIDLSHANCMNTQFFSTKLIRTNLTGVDLNTALFDSHTVALMDSVIVSYADRFPYIKNLQEKLLFILSQGKQGYGGEDPLYQSTQEEIRELYELIMFDLTESCLSTGIKKGGGSQSIWLETGFDQRYINKAGLSEAEVELLQKSAERRLLGNDDFTVPQKALFHHMRAAMWVLIKLDWNIHMKKMQSQQDLGEEFKPEGLCKIDALLKIYIMGEHNQSRVHPLLKTMCFEAVFPIVQKQYEQHGVLDRHQSEEVCDFFALDSYNW